MTVPPQTQKTYERDLVATLVGLEVLAELGDLSVELLQVALEGGEVTL